ncbi:MAG TPA: MBL fold metallo-hydrolase [Solirubrobacteraceae bacterium]|nr:MBL fold metallo-hydrolase [Solirubrobacteraceae bacterium]
MTRLEVPGQDITGVRADNPGPFTLSGTNTWIVGSDPAWLVDPGPDLYDHAMAVIAEVEQRGGLGGIALTHDHSDHSGAVPTVRQRFPHAPLAAARGDVDRLLRDGSRFGPLEVVSTPGHAPDHIAFIVGSAGLTGDAVLGQGSVFIAPDPGALTRYLEALRELRRRDLDVLLPGHGPLVDEPAAKLDEYVAHRLDRERRLVEGLEAGARTVPEMLDAAWADVPEPLRPAATVTLAAHLDKLQAEGRLPDGVQRPGPEARTASEPRNASLPRRPTEPRGTPGER